jgi:hypothetical protein
MSENLKNKDKIINILKSGKYKFTEEDVEALSELTGGNRTTDPEVNREQVVFDNLKTYTDAELVSQSRELFLSMYNKELERDMISEVLIHRGYDLRKLNRTVEGYHRFMKNTAEENEKYGL